MTAFEVGTFTIPCSRVPYSAGGGCSGIARVLSAACRQRKCRPDSRFPPSKSTNWQGEYEHHIESHHGLRGSRDHTCSSAPARTVEVWAGEQGLGVGQFYREGFPLHIEG